MQTTHLTRPRIWIALVFGLGLLVACGAQESIVAADETPDDSEVVDDGGEPIPIDTDALRDSTWTLRFGGGRDGEIPMVDGWPITIAFDGDTFGGTAACNGYGGTYTSDGFSLALTDISWTEMGCESDVHASEAAFLAALLDVTEVNLLGNELVLGGVSTELIFDAADS